MSEACRGRNPVENLIVETTSTYQDEMYEGIQKMIENWEAKIKQESELEEEIDDWGMMVPDLGNTCGRITEFKHTIYFYFLMKCFLGKAMEQISMGMVVTVQGLPSYKTDMEKILFQLYKHNIRMDRIDCHIPCILELYGMLGVTIEDPTPVASVFDERKEKKYQSPHAQFLFMQLAFKFPVCICYLLQLYSIQT